MNAKKPHGEDAALELTSSTKRHGDYAVGKWRPPVKSQFPKGVSGNPKGRPRRSRRISKSVKEILAETIPVREGNLTHKISKYEALCKVLVNAALNGDMKALLKVLSMVPHSEMNQQFERLTKSSEPMTEEEAIREYQRMVRGKD